MRLDGTLSRFPPLRPLLEAFTGTRPAEPIRLPVKTLQHSPAVCRRARLAHGDDDFISQLERVPLDALLADRSAAPPLQRPPLHRSVSIRRATSEERTR